MKDRPTIVELMDLYVEAYKMGQSRKEIEQGMLENGITHDEIKEVKRSIERLDLLEFPGSGNNGFAANTNLILGSIILIAGVTLTGGSLLGYFDFGGYAIITYGPILGGAGMVYKGIR